MCLRRLAWKCCHATEKLGHWTGYGNIVHVLTPKCRCQLQSVPLYRVTLHCTEYVVSDLGVLFIQPK